MGLILTEGFDIYDSATDLASGEKWVAEGTPNVHGSYARHGARGLILNANGERISRILPVADRHATTTIGVALMCIGGSAGVGGCVIFSSSADVEHGGLAIEYTGVIYARDATGNNTPITTLTSGVWYYIEVQLIVGNAGVGVLKIWKDGILIYNDQTLDYQAGAVTTTEKIIINSPGTTLQIDDIYVTNGAGSVNNSNLGDVRITTLKPNGNGSSSQGVGSDGNSVDNYLLVDEVPSIFDVSDDDYVDLVNDNDKDTYAFEDLTGNIDTVYGVCANVYAIKSDSGPRSLALVARTSGTELDGADQVVNSDNADIFFTCFDTQADGSTAWSKTAVNAAEFGVKARP